MFKSEREMQEKFVKKLSEKSKLDIFQEVGNMACFFRADVVEYSMNKTYCYELKLNDFNKLIEQCDKHLRFEFFNSICAVVPANKIDNFIKCLNNKKIINSRLDRLKVISFDGNEMKLIKRGKMQEVKIDTKFWLADLIVRGYHLDGKNKRKHYK